MSVSTREASAQNLWDTLCMTGFSDANIDDFFVSIFIDIVFLLQKQRGRGITFANTMKSYKSHTMTDRVINQNYYNYEQYG